MSDEEFLLFLNVNKISYKVCKLLQGKRNKINGQSNIIQSYDISYPIMVATMMNLYLIIDTLN